MVKGGRPERRERGAGGWGRERVQGKASTSKTTMIGITLDFPKEKSPYGVNYLSNTRFTIVKWTKLFLLKIIWVPLVFLIHVKHERTLVNN